MPYTLRDDHPDCSGWAVVNKDTGKVVPGGCHGSKAAAQKHLAALQANVTEGKSGGIMEFRRFPAQVEFRADGDGREFWAVMLVYDRVDDYRTTFRSGIFDAQLRAGDWPPLLYGHNWMDLAAVLGQWVEQRPDVTKLITRARFDDFEAVQGARQASVQLRSGTLKEFSVGFTRHEDRKHPDKEGVTEITEGYWDEGSIVPRGAVPGTKLLSMRASGLVVPAGLAAQVLAELGAGSVDLAEALTKLKGAAVDPQTVEALADKDKDNPDNPAGNPDQDQGVGTPISPDVDGAEPNPDLPPPHQKGELDEQAKELLQELDEYAAEELVS